MCKFWETTNDTADGKKQTIHTREITLQDGKTTKIVITHKGTDGLVTEGTKTYTINIARKAASSDAKLAGLEIYLISALIVALLPFATAIRLNTLML